jgi:glycosyltransferase involved in cell wall biosynthesis
VKVLYVISSHESGRGGHYHSLDHISRSLADGLDARIVSIGLNESAVLLENPLYLGHLDFEWWNVLGLDRRFREVFEQFTPDLIHCFDMGSHLMLQLLPSTRGRTMVLNRCGGPNPRRRFCAVADTMIVFSRENYDWFAGNRRFRDSTLHLVPNRVRAVEILPLGERTHARPQDTFGFVRIARIGRYYERSIRQSIELVRRLRDRHRVHLHVIGVVEDPEVLSELEDEVRRDGLPVTLITGGETRQAARLLYLADAVIGTGRGAMEAMALGLPVLAPVQNAETPVLVSEHTFDDLFATNFSERGTVDPVRAAGAMEAIEAMITDPERYRRLAEQSAEWFDTHFSIDGARERYMEVYRMAVEKGPRPLLWRNALHVVQQLKLIRQRQRATRARGG